MFNKFLQKIRSYSSIVLLRHSRPDMDALGSQLGLKSLLIDNFPDKQVYAIGDMARPCFLGSMDQIDDEVFTHSLIIISDVSVLEMMEEFPFEKAKEILVFDHHNNECNIKNAQVYRDKTAGAACQIIAEFAYKNKLRVNVHTATCLYTGMVTDTNRFNFSLSKKLFVIASKLIESGADTQNIYKNLYNESLEKVRMRCYFQNQFKVTDCNVAYLMNDASIFEKFPVDFFSISRGMVNVMANIREIPIWCNFTEDPQTHKIVCEFRSKEIPIVDIAKKYGGGGHLLACGATIDSFEVAYEVLEDFNRLVKGE